MRDDRILPFVLAVIVVSIAFAGPGGSVIVQEEQVEVEKTSLQSGGLSEGMTVEVTDIEADTVVAEWGTTIGFSATVINTGDEEVVQEIEFAVEDVGVLDTETVALDAGEQQVVEFTAIDTGTIPEEGHYEFTVSSSHDSKSGTLVVEDPTPSVLFEISDIEITTDPENVSLDEDEDVTVSANVTNTGEQRATQTIELRADNATVEEKELTLGSGESERVTFVRTGVNHTLDREYSYSIASGNHELVGTLVVEASDEGADDEGADDTTTDDTVVDDTADDDGQGFSLGVSALALLAVMLLTFCRQRRIQGYTGRRNL